MVRTTQYDKVAKQSTWSLDYTKQYLLLSLYECMSECSRINVCMSLSYNKQTKECRLAWAPANYYNSTYMISDTNFDTYDLRYREF